MKVKHKHLAVRETTQQLVVTRGECTPRSLAKSIREAIEDSQNAATTGDRAKLWRFPRRRRSLKSGMKSRGEAEKAKWRVCKMGVCENGDKGEAEKHNGQNS